MEQAKTRCDWTYPVHNRQAGVTAFDHEAVHRPSPVPVAVNCSIAAHENKIARSELLVPEIRPGNGAV